MIELLPKRFAMSMSKLNLSQLNELRLRVDKPTLIHYGEWCYLGENGISCGKGDYLLPSFSELNEIVYKACECSVYAHNDQIKCGFVSYKGVRIGLCGEVVTEGKEIVTIKNFSSLVIRFPHEIIDCSLSALRYLIEDEALVSTLVVSPPGCGKTTFIRDLVRQITTKHIMGNVLIIDERGEIGAVENGKPTLCVGENVDVFSGISKVDGVSLGIRSLSPSVVVLDEIMTLDDCAALSYALGCGVVIIATIHSQSLSELKKKSVYHEIEQIFERVVVLSDRCGVGTIENVFSPDGESLFSRG